MTHHKNQLVTKCYIGPLILTDILERHRQRKIDMRFGTSSVRTFYGASSLKIACKVAKYNLEI
jgi:hypothetical protein